MQDLIIMSRPGIVEKRARALDVLRSIADANPGITWGEVSRQAAAELSTMNGLAGPGLNGWLSNAINIVGAAGDPFTFGYTSKTLKALRDVGGEVFDRDRVQDSLSNAGRGIFDDALNRFLDALPGGLGNDIRVGNVVTRFWLPVVLVGGLIWFMFFRRGRR